MRSLFCLCLLYKLTSFFRFSHLWFLQSSVKAFFQYLSVVRQFQEGPERASSLKSDFCVEGTVRDRKGGLIETGPSKKHKELKRGDKIAFVKATTAKLVCTSKSKVPLKGAAFLSMRVV
jgi:hypothetical protein